MQRGEIWWADQPATDGSGPALTRPVIVIQDDAFNQSDLRTVIVALLSSNPKLANMPGNVWLEASESGLARDSVINVSQLVTLDRSVLRDCVRQVGEVTLELLNRGLLTVLGLPR
jgi:mRNA interferase MazF